MKHRAMSALQQHIH